MKQISSKAFKEKGLEKTQIVTDEVWADIVARGWAKKYDVVDIHEKVLKDVPKIIPVEVKTKTDKKND